LEVQLTRRNIPFVKFGGLKFLESAHVKDVLAILRILENPRDAVSWFRVLQLLDGIGPAGARALMDAMGVPPAAYVPRACSGFQDGARAGPGVATPTPAGSATAGDPGRPRWTRVAQRGV